MRAALIGLQCAAAFVVAARAFRIGLVQALELVGIELHLADGELALQRLGRDPRFKRPGVGQRPRVDDADGSAARHARPVGLRHVRRLRLGEPGAVDDQRGQIDGRLDLGRTGVGFESDERQLGGAVGDLDGMVRGPTATALASICVRSAVASCSPLPPASPDSTASEVATTANGVGACIVDVAELQLALAGGDR